MSGKSCGWTPPHWRRRPKTHDGIVFAALKKNCLTVRPGFGKNAMTSLTPLLALAALDILSTAIPGPNVFLVTQTAVNHGRTRATLAAAGILAASLIWAGLTLMGLIGLFAVISPLQTVLRMLGAAFLIYMGIQFLRRSAVAPSSHIGAKVSATGAMFRGFATGALNPKSLAYFATIFVLFVPADAPAAYRISAFIIVIFDGILVYGALAMLFSTAAAQAVYLAVRRPIDRVCGAIIGSLGRRLMLQR
jgi:threonine efflux protein